MDIIYKEKISPKALLSNKAFLFLAAFILVAVNI